MLAENRLLCDCRLKWVFELKKKTKNEDLRQSLQRIECYYDDISHGMTNTFENSLKARPNGPNDNGDYNEEQAFDGDLNAGNVIQLLRFEEPQLPCPQRLSDPTELPLSRESIGMDLSWRSDAAGNSSSASSLVVVSSISVKHYFCLTTFFLYIGLLFQ